PLLIWWTPLCRMLRIMTRRFTLYAYDKVAALNIGDLIIIAGKNARPGTFGGIFLDDSKIMTDMISKKKRQILVVNGGVYDREICQK
ncbi:hypothetical protein PO640_26130, partial [Citrobacter freundii]